MVVTGKKFTRLRWNWSLLKMNSELEKTVVTLERVSLEQQAGPDRSGLDAQRARNARTIEAYGLKSVGRVVLTNVSGASVREAPEIKNLQKKIERGEIGGLVVPSLDRLGRTCRFEDFSLFQVFQDTGAVIYTGDAILRPSSTEGFLTSVLKTAMDGVELQNIRRRMWGGREELRKKALCASGPQSLPMGIGYSKSEKKYLLLSPEIDAVKLAFELVDVHGIKNYCEISRRTGGGIKDTSLKNILRNPIYSGTRVYDMMRGAEKYASVNGRQADKKKIRRAPEDVIKVQIFDDPPVDPARFDRVQKILAETHRRWQDIRSHKPHVTFLAQGVAVCDFCGSPLRGSAHPRRNGVVLSYYRCRSNVPRFRERTGGCCFAHQRRAAVDNALRRLICDELSRPPMIRRLIENFLEAKRLSAGAGQTVEEIEATLAKIAASRKRLWDAYEKGLTTLVDLEPRLVRLDAQKAATESLLVQTKRPADSDIMRTAKRIARGALAFRRISDASAQKIAINQLLSKVTFRESRIVGVTFRPQFALADGLEMKADDIRAAQ